MRGILEGIGVMSDEKYNIWREVNFLNLVWGIIVGVEYSILDNISLIGGLGF